MAGESSHHRSGARREVPRRMHPVLPDFASFYAEE